MGNQYIDLIAAERETLQLHTTHTVKDVSLYALGIGAATDPLDESELQYVFELSKSFQITPTFASLPPFNAMLQNATAASLGLPGMNFGFDRILHAEQYTEVKAEYPTHGELFHTFKMKHAYDKAPNAVVTFGISTTDSTGTEVAYNETTLFAKGAGGWDGDRGPSHHNHIAPTREADCVIEQHVPENQALLYRLSGDWNPLHASPEFAKKFGFERPILHGMCTYGIAARHVIKAFGSNNSKAFKSIRARFAQAVMPGETLQTRMWKESDTLVIVEVWSKDRNVAVIKNAAVELNKQAIHAK